jgi:hypothetical protein
MNNEFQNMDDKEKWGWLTLSYEMVENVPQGYKTTKHIQQSIGPPRCGGNATNPFGASNVMERTLHPKMQTFSEHTIPYIALKNGWLLGNGGHMHDGGLQIDTFLNDEMICSSKPHYNMSGGMPGMPGMKIDRYEICEFRPPKPLKKGDVMYARVDYDFTKHEG